MLIYFAGFQWERFMKSARKVVYSQSGPCATGSTFAGYYQVPGMF